MTELWKHQAEAVERAKTLDSFGLFFEVGTGKTLTTIKMLQDKYGDKPLLPTLILCPPIVIQNWKRELLKFTDIPEKDIITLTGTGRKREANFTAANKNKIFITNYETLLMKGLFDKLLFWAPQCLVLDESHKCKDIKSKRTKLVVRLGDKAKYKYILSGTPILNSLLDIWSQYRVLDPKLFGKNFFTFRAVYFMDNNRHLPRNKYFPSWVPKPEASNAVYEMIKKNSMFVQKEECLDLPPFVKTRVDVTLSPKQRRAYNEVKKDFISYIGDAACVVELALVKSLRLQQIASGYIPVVTQSGETRKHQFKDNPRGQALKDILTDLGTKHKIIIWAVFRDNYETIRNVCDQLDLKYVECHGDVSPNHKQKNIDAFNNDDDVRVFIGHPMSAGIGINLVVSDVSIFYTRNFSLENDQQAEARNYRGGSEIHKKITRIDIVTTDTIDEQVLLALASKKKIGYEVLKGMDL